MSEVSNILFYCVISTCIILIRSSPPSMVDVEYLLLPHSQESSQSESPSNVRTITRSGLDLEYSDTVNGQVTNSDQQVVYINHGGGAVSTIRRSFVVPFSPHVTSYPSSLYDGPSSDPESIRDDRGHHEDGFSRRAGANDERGYEDPSFDEPAVRDHYESSFEDARDDPPSEDPVTTPPPLPSPPAPLGLPVPPTSYGTRTNSRGSRNPSSPPPDHYNSRSDNNNPKNDHHHNQPQSNRNNVNNNLNPILNPFGNPFGPQGFAPDFFSLFDAPFNTNPNTGHQDNLFQRRRLSINNNAPDVHSNQIGPGYPSYNYYTGGEDDATQKWPKIFKFTDGRINLNDFEKDKKLGRIKFSKKDPHFDNIRRDSFLILHGGTYS